MVQVWYMDTEETDQRLEHHRNPPAYLELEDLYKKTGVEYFKASETTTLNLCWPWFRAYLDYSLLQINADEYQSDNTLTELRAQRGYTYDDEARSMFPYWMTIEPI